MKITDDDVKLLAEKVLLYRVFVSVGAVRLGSPNGKIFDPRKDDNDLMRLWDKFSEEYNVDLGRRMGKSAQAWNVAYWDKDDFYSGVRKGSTHVDRREAMLECMLKAVKNNQK